MIEREDVLEKSVRDNSYYYYYYGVFPSLEACYYYVYFC